MRTISKIAKSSDTLANHMENIYGSTDQLNNRFSILTKEKLMNRQVSKYTKFCGEAISAKQIL